MKASHLIILVSIATGIAACGERPGHNNAAAQATAVHVATAAAQATAVPVSHLERNVVADKVQFQSNAAKIDGDALVSTGASGFMMFGPYVAMAPGNYRATVMGTVTSLQDNAEIRFDIVSDTATKTHAQKIINVTTADSGPILELDVAIPEGVRDLELRAFVTPGAAVRIDSYRFTKNN